MMRKVLTRLAAIVFGILLAWLLAEIGVRVLYKSLPMGLQISLRDVRVTPFSEDRLAPAPLWQSDRAYQTIARPGATDSLQAGSPTVLFHATTYSWWGGRVGFRSPPPDTGRVEAVALGDSHTFCFTEMPDCWVSLVAKQTGLNISDLGEPVTGSVAHQRLYIDFVAKPELKLGQPKLVLWQFYGNDYNDDYGLAALNGTAKSPAPVPITSVRTPPTGPALWFQEHSVIFTLIQAFARGKDEGVDMFVDPQRVIIPGQLDISFGQSYIRDAFDMSQPRNQEGEQISHEAILQTRQTVEQNGGKFIILVMPTKEEVYRPLTEPKLGKDVVDAIAAPRLRLLDFCTAQHLTCLDLLAPLQARAGQNSQLFYPTDPHLNAQGNQVIASAIADFLRTQGITN